MELSFLLQQEIFFNIKKKKNNIQNNQTRVFLAVNNAL